MIMSLVNTKITSKHCDAMIFSPHTQGSFTILRMIMDLGCFSRKSLIPLFICHGYHEMHAYSKAIFLLPKSVGSPNLNTK